LILLKAIPGLLSVGGSGPAVGDPTLGVALRADGVVDGDGVRVPVEDVAAADRLLVHRCRGDFKPRRARWACVVEELDLDKTDRYRTHWPFLRDRRIDSYQQITKRYIDEDA